MANLYALLVGIDSYPPPIRSLSGCVNDIAAMQDLLGKRFGGPGLKILTLANKQATREKVIGAFRSHFDQASKDDVALFHFSGHGSQVPNNGLFTGIKPGRLLESIVCYDSRSGAPDLVDKDIATLISEVTSRGVHMTVILDSCHSGSATRDLVEVVRGIPARDDAQEPKYKIVARPRGVQSDSDAAAAAEAGKLTLAPADFVPDTTGLHVLLAACQDNQSAKEYLVGTDHHGAFSYFLVQTLNAASQPLGYQELIRLVRQRIQAKVADQVPQLESLNGDEALSNFFLGLTPSPLVEFSIANYTITRHWQIDSGGLHSVSLGDRYALFPTTASAADLADSSRAIATGRVATLLPAAATLLIDNPAALKTTEAYKAVLTLRASTIGVAFQGEPKGILALRAAMATATLIHEDLNPRFIVVCENSTFTITAGSRTVFGPHTQTPENARAFVILLEHMAKWTMRLELQNPSSKIPSSAVQFTIIQPDNSELECPPLTKLDLAYFRDALGQPQPPSFRARVTNHSAQLLYVALLVFTESWSISTGLVASGTQKLGPSESFYPLSGRPIHASIKDPDADKTQDELFLIVSTDDFDAFAFKQPPLDLRLEMENTRDLDFGDPVDLPVHDFQTRRITLLTTRNL